MKEIANYLFLLTIVLTAGSSCASLTPLDVVRDFGAVADGVTPTQVQFQKAVNYALSNNISDIYIPTGTYLLVTNYFYALTTRTNAGPPPNIPNQFRWAAVTLPFGNGQRIRFIGEPGATLLFTNSLTEGGLDGTVTNAMNNGNPLDYYASTLFNAWGKGDLLQFQNINFISQHVPAPADEIKAIEVGDKDGELLYFTNVVVKNCSFRDWGHAAHITHAWNVTTTGNTHRYTRGRDEEQGGLDGLTPAVAWFCRWADTVICEHEDFIGSDVTNYTVTPLTGQWNVPMDGLWWGWARNSRISHNNISRLAAEGIAINGRELRYFSELGWDQGSHLGSHVISENVIDGDLQTGQTFVGFTGIAFQDNGGLIANNILRNCNAGILCLWDYPWNTNLNMLRITGNQIRLASMVQSSNLVNAFSILGGIRLAGYGNVNITDNQVVYSDRCEFPGALGYNVIPCYDVASCAHVTLENNEGNCEVSPYTTGAYPSNRWELVGIRIILDADVKIGPNRFSNLDAGLTLDPATPDISVDPQPLYYETVRQVADFTLRNYPTYIDPLGPGSIRYPILIDRLKAGAHARKVPPPPAYE